MNIQRPIPWRRDYMALTGLIRRERKAQRMTQAQAGELLGMTERSYRDFENGHRDIRLQELFRLCGALDIRVFDPEAERNRKEVSGSQVSRQLGRAFVAAPSLTDAVRDLAEAGVDLELPIDWRDVFLAWFEARADYKADDYSLLLSIIDIGGLPPFRKPLSEGA